MQGLNVVAELRSRTLFSSCFMLVVGLTAVDFFNPSLPQIMESLHATQLQAKNLIVIYMGVLGGAQLLYGSLSDRVGRKPAILIAFAIASVGLVGSSTAQSINSLYGWRALTALGTAGCTVIARAMIVDVYIEQAALRKAFSYFALSGQISPGLAPLAGAWVQETLGWRYSFITVACLTGVAFLVLMAAMAETHSHRTPRQNFRSGLSAYARLGRDLTFLCSAASSGVIYAFTVGYFASAPYVFHALGFTPLGMTKFFLCFSAGTIGGAILAGSWLGRIEASRLYLHCNVAYSSLLVLGLIGSIGESTSQTLMFSISMGAICGVAAPLVLAINMSSVAADRGAASAMQGAIKMIVTAACMSVFDLVHIRSFIGIIAIFSLFSLTLWILVIVRRLAETRAGGNAPH